MGKNKEKYFNLAKEIATLLTDAKTSKSEKLFLCASLIESQKSFIEKLANTDDKKLDFYQIVTNEINRLHPPQNSYITATEFRYYLGIEKEKEENFSGLGESQLMHDQTLKFASIITQNQFESIVNILPKTITNPSLFHNLCDILIESIGRRQIEISFEDIRFHLIRNLRLSVSKLEQCGYLHKIQILEAASNLGLTIENEEFYEIYIKEIKPILRQNASARIIGQISWWSDRYFGSKKIAIDSHIELLNKPTYRLVRYHTSLILSGLTDNSYQSYLETASLEYIKAFDPLYEPSYKEKIMEQSKRKVFIIHGHNEAKKRELESMLKDNFNLETIILDNLPDKGCSTVIEKFEYYARDCEYVIAIFTPDDEIKKENVSYLQARPNVIFELGWFFRHLGRQRVMLICQQDTEVFSDISGILQKRFINNVKELYKDIQDELQIENII